MGPDSTAKDEAKVLPCLLCGGHKDIPCPQFFVLQSLAAHAIPGFDNPATH